MKFLLLSIVLLSAHLGFAQQTAVNFTAPDCNGTSHELFTELDAGKVVVIVWVMPCAACIHDALMAQDEVQNANNAHPGKVVYFLADDYGNTSCGSLKNWCNNNGITLPTVFSSNKINMADYGAVGMPKAVILGGGTAHKVYYEEIAPAIDQSAFSSALATCIAESSSATGVKETAPNNVLNVWPNPSEKFISISSGNEPIFELQILNAMGQEIVSERFDNKTLGTNQTYQLGPFAPGYYSVVVRTERALKYAKVLVTGR